MCIPDLFIFIKRICFTWIGEKINILQNVNNDFFCVCVSMGFSADFNQKLQKKNVFNLNADGVMKVVSVCHTDDPLRLVAPKTWKHFTQL